MDWKDSLRRAFAMVRRASEWLYSPRTPVASRAEWLVRAGIQVTAGVFAFAVLTRIVAPLTHSTPPATLPPDQGDVKFGVPEATRRAVFARIADSERTSLTRSMARFPDQAWSREDDQGADQRDAARALAGQFRLDLTQVYLIIDEGIREHWPGADGQPLRATITPLDPRKQ